MLAPTSTTCMKFKFPKGNIWTWVFKHKLVANIDKSRILCGHCGIMCKYDTQLTFEHDRSPLWTHRLLPEPVWYTPSSIQWSSQFNSWDFNLSLQIILLVMIFGCIIISDCGRMMIWKIQMAVEGSESWKQFLIYWKKFKRKLDTGCGLCPDLEIEGWETNSY